MFKNHRKIVFILVFFSFLFCQMQTKLIAKNQNVQQNFEIIDSLIEVSMIEIFEKLSTIKEFNSDTVNYYISENEADWLIQRHFTNKFSESVLTNNKLAKNNFIGITVEKIDLNYNFIDKKNNLINRNVNLKLFVSVNNKHSQTFTFEIDKKNEDTVSFSQLEFVNRSSFNFAKTEIPKKNLSFWNKYLEPTIAVVSAAIVTTLFFTVRSQ